ncbi:hypothetical protein AGIG_G9011 [Arapaima gigas]
MNRQTYGTGGQREDENSRVEPLVLTHGDGLGSTGPTAVVRPGESLTDASLAKRLGGDQQSRAGGSGGSFHRQDRSHSEDTGGFRGRTGSLWEPVLSE